MSLLKVKSLVKKFSIPKKDGWFGHAELTAVDGVTFEMQEGETLGIVGESGSGKSTLGRCIMRLEEPTSGGLELQGTDFLALKSKALRDARRDLQMVFQDPYASLNPRMAVRELVTEPLLLHKMIDKSQIHAEAGRLLDMVGLEKTAADRLPHAFSGGQRQRVVIARAIATRPRLLIADEAVSSLDISIQAQILKLLKELRAELGMALVFISHDLRVVEYLSDRVAVMRAGKFVEMGKPADIYGSPQSAYTRELLSSRLNLPE
jgi:ABC-type oligopeptide transport system ATPase subunit